MAGQPGAHGFSQPTKHHHSHPRSTISACSDAYSSASSHSGRMSLILVLQSSLLPSGSCVPCSIRKPIASAVNSFELEAMPKRDWSQPQQKPTHILRHLVTLRIRLAGGYDLCTPDIPLVVRSIEFRRSDDHNGDSLDVPPLAGLVNLLLELAREDPVVERVAVAGSEDTGPQQSLSCVRDETHRNRQGMCNTNVLTQRASRSAVRMAMTPYGSQVGSEPSATCALARPKWSYL